MRAGAQRFKLRKLTEKAQAGGENQDPEPGTQSKETASSTHLGPWWLPAGRSWRDPLRTEETASAAASTLLAAPLFYSIAAENTSSPLPQGLGCCTDWSPSYPGPSLPLSNTSRRLSLIFFPVCIKACCFCISAPKGPQWSQGCIHLSSGNRSPQPQTHGNHY